MSSSSELLLRVYQDTASHEHDRTLTFVFSEPILRIYLEKDRGDWPREYLEVRIRGTLFYTWHICPITGAKKLIDTHVVERPFRFVAWLLLTAERPAPWPE